MLKNLKARWSRLYLVAIAAGVILYSTVAFGGSKHTRRSCFSNYLIEFTNPSKPGSSGRHTFPVDTSKRDEAAENLYPMSVAGGQVNKHRFA